jgi:hypothetical protein
MSRGTRHREVPPVADRKADVVAWRRRRLERAGFDHEVAASFAADRRVDLHALLDLVDRGCPPHLAARILAPLEEASAAHR